MSRDEMREELARRMREEADGLDYINPETGKGHTNGEAKGEAKGRARGRARARPSPSRLRCSTS